MNLFQNSIRLTCVLILAFTSECMLSQQFALKNDSTVVFYGDSITAQRRYTRFVEEFVLTRYPKLHINFINGGVSGDTVYGGYGGTMVERVGRDVEPFHPTMITVMLGMNDGGYGFKSDAEILPGFRKGYNELLEELHRTVPEAGFTLVNPTPYDEITHGTGVAGYSAVVDRISGEVSTIAEQRQVAGKMTVLRADLHSAMIDALTQAKRQFPQLAPLLIPDRVHPEEASSWIMAVALTSAWHADPVVSHVVLNSKTMHAVETQKTVLTNLETTSNGLNWTQLDDALPLPLDFTNVMMTLLFSISKIEDFDQETLCVTGLATGQYQLLIDSKPVATFSGEALQHGVNLALFKTPMLNQAYAINFYAGQRTVLDQVRAMLLVDVKQTPGSTGARDRLLEAENEFSAKINAELEMKPHRYELRVQ